MLSRYCSFLIVFCLASLIWTQASNAQDTTDPGTGGGTEDTIGAGFSSGVSVDADGVLRGLVEVDPTGQLARQRAEQALANLDRDIATPSKLRKVSLTRLTRLIEKAIDEGHGPDEAMKYLAGLTRIEYVFFYPKTQDVVIAGPAEAWFEETPGRYVGINSGQPTLELQDLVVALRAFPPSQQSNPLVYCSIDATPEGLSRMQQFLSQIGRQIQPNDERFIVEGLRENLGLQVVTLGGISASTHFAQVMVEADYRMKLIGIGLEDTPVRIKSYLSLASFASIARNAMCRWWFVPDYQRIRVTDDATAAEFVGNGVKLVGEDEMVGPDGIRQQVGSQNRASRAFTQSFTRKYSQLAEQVPVYGQLRNCIDMLIAAAFIQKHDLYGQAGWDLGALGDESVYPVETYNAPRQVESAVNSMWKGRQLATPVGGGVEIRAQQALDQTMADEDGSLRVKHDAIDLAELPADQWWWD
ncbi:MAG: DUF1598 domain-containing protein [Planctomycetales bacterium]|nr:DUF1598 domain-containing protein [Planctomycetales bacterium]